MPTVRSSWPSADAGSAIGNLRKAAAIWQQLDAPYEAGAHPRARRPGACEASATRGRPARNSTPPPQTYRSLGAAPDLDRVARPRRTAGCDCAPGGLTAREVEVLRLVAAGKTNRAIASELVLSEKTVARHVSNIFVKLDLSSRAAATAYAYENELV